MADLTAKEKEHELQWKARNKKGGSSGLPQYTFPTDMAHEYYPEAIKFTILKRNGVDLKKSLKAGIDGWKTASNNIAKVNSYNSRIEKQKELIKAKNGVAATKEVVAAAEKQIAALNSERSKLGLNLTGADTADLIKGAGLGFANDAGKQYSKVKTSYTEATADIIKTIYLNMPDALPSYEESVEWAGSDMGMIGSLIQSGAGEGAAAGVLNNLGTLAAGGIGAAAGKIFGSGGMGGGILGTVLGGDKLQNLSEHAQGAIQNPFKEQTFQGIGFRSFQFSFTMRARSSNDVEVIRGIIDCFRAYSKPSFKSYGSASTFKYPHEFGIEFLSLMRGTGDDAQYHQNENLPAIKFCICETVSTNFGEAWKAHEGGAPLTVKLDLTFKETELVTQDDILGLGHVGRFARSGRKF